MATDGKRIIGPGNDHRTLLSSRSSSRSSHRNAMPFPPSHLVVFAGKRKEKQRRNEDSSLSRAHENVRMCASKRDAAVIPSMMMLMMMMMVENAHLSCPRFVLNSEQLLFPVAIFFVSFCLLCLCVLSVKTEFGLHGPPQ